MKTKILVVDNHPMILKLMANLLEKGGHEVKTASDGLSALDILKSFTPEIIFIDLVMPNIGGEKLCRIIRTMPEFNDSYIVILSAIAAEEVIDFASFGADACIAKGPFKKIAEHVATVLEHRAQKGNVGLLSKDAIGYDEMYEREVTKELLSSKRHFEAILHDIVEGILELTSEGRVIYANPAAAKLIGMPEEKLLAVNFEDFFTGKDRECVRATIIGLKGQNAAINEQNQVSLGEKLAAINFLPIKDGYHRSIIVIMSDVTERRQIELELDNYRKHLEELVQERTKELQDEIAERRIAEMERQRLHLQLQQTQKMEAIGTLAGGIAHDFNNILSAILGYAELSLTQTSTEGKVHEYLTKITKSVDRAADLVKQILTFSRQTEHERKPMQLQPVMKETLKLLRGSMPATIDIRFEIAPGCGMIMANFSQIHQVLMNLCTNAYQAMREKGGVLSVNLSEEELPQGMVKNGLGLQPGRYARLSVQDTGTGIDKDIQNRIFEPYFTTKKHGEGTGLGLATVHGVVLSHGGGINVTSAPGEGALFDVYFPILEKKERIVQEDERGQASSPRMARILFVDDEEMITELAASVLGRMDCRVLALTNSIEALAVFEEDPRQFDLVITDQTMPGLTGVELAKKMLAVRKDLPIILSTGFSEIVNEQQAKEVGIREFIMKPLAIRDLYKVICKVLGDKGKAYDNQ